MKKLLILGLSFVLTLSAVGCTGPRNTAEESNTHVVETEEEVEFYVSPTDQFKEGDLITIGEIVDFKGDTIHIMSGDLIEVFAYDNSNAKDFYIGQTVQLTKGAESNTLSTFEKEDYTITHSNMGHFIDQVSGKLVNITDKSIVIENSTGKAKVSLHEPIDALIGDQVTAYTMTFDTTPSAIMVINESSKLLLTIKEITREDDGAMTLLLTDADQSEYTINASYETMELDMSKLVVGDTLTVYYKAIMESWPMQLDTILIRK